MKLDFLADMLNMILPKETYILVLKDKHFLMSIDNDKEDLFRIYTNTEKLLYLDDVQLKTYLLQFEYNQSIEIKIKWDGGKDFRK